MAIRRLTDIDWLATAGLIGLLLAGAAMISLGLSLRWGGVLVDLTTGKTRPRLKPRVAGSFWLLWPLLFIALGGASLVAAAAAQDPGGLFGQTGAGWMQAVGSVVAIVAAIVVDQGASRRLRQDDVKKERAISARRAGAINQAAEALVGAAAEVRAANVALNDAVGLSSLSIQRLRGAEAALEYLHQQGAELDVAILAALCLSLETYKEDCAWALKHQPVVGPTNALAYATSLETAADRQKAIFKDAFRHVAKGVR